ncbi:ATP-dependent DNA helicase RecG [Geminicoccus sp.]|jgi:ATP-dependent DNA helicase RecG|uniref:ATP-dependent DNA helicase RecG n=1 Tax=Geminicoccus sp. TaxID=2024832 RepID=UPI002E371EBF|nr:ATP-dependent DNA helicase RecG [Geminicoccus sp.]
MGDGSKDGTYQPVAMPHERPSILLPLFAPLRGLQGVGPALERRLARLLQAADPVVLDLLMHLPSSFLESRPMAALSDEDEGRSRTLRVRILSHQHTMIPTRPTRIHAEGPAGDVELVFFKTPRSMLEQRFTVGRDLLIHGRLQRFNGRWQMAHPERLDPAEADLPIPVYPSIGGLHQGVLRGLVRRALKKLPLLEEWQEDGLLRAAGWPRFDEALRLAHAAPDRAAGARLAMDELLSIQLGLAIARRARERASGRSTQGDGRLRRQLIASLPFQLTSDQERAVNEVVADMASPAPMLRLLQGDVGSGKTLVALLAMLAAYEAGCQAALMAPTEVLATQHAAGLGRLLAPMGLAPLLLAARIKGKDRAAILERLRSGEPALVVGTHALLKDEAAFTNLALAVVDEQHRFGVRQRLTLRSKGRAVDLLLMTATPIPRTAAMSMHGDIAVSIIAERPPGRLPIATAAVPMDRIEEIYAAVQRRLERGERIYWVCPAIDMGEEEDRSAVEARVLALRERFDTAVGVVHGRLKEVAKNAAMADFVEGRTPLLLATTVIEVGVDVPQATLIVIEAAEKFGLAQLHQLRGRVGRGPTPSACILLWRNPISAMAKARLASLRASDDGFYLAEQDLSLRGPGEILGDRQSGMPEFKLADLARHAELVTLAASSARRMLGDDPMLTAPQGRALRILLHVFRRTDALGLLDGG